MPVHSVTIESDDEVAVAGSGSDAEDEDDDAEEMFTCAMPGADDDFAADGTSSSWDLVRSLGLKAGSAEGTTLIEELLAQKREEGSAPLIKPKSDKAKAKAAAKAKKRAEESAAAEDEDDEDEDAVRELAASKAGAKSLARKKKEKEMEKSEGDGGEGGGDGEDDEGEGEEEDGDDGGDEAAIRAGFFDEVHPALGEGGKPAATVAFSQLHLSRPLLRAVEALGFVEPTPVQARCIPLALAGRDVCGSAATGSGKSAAFLLPVLERLLHRPANERGGAGTTRVLVVTPTRELAAQCHVMMTKLAQFAKGVSGVLIVGGAKNLRAQEAELRMGPDVVICTPGRMVDHLTNSAGARLAHTSAHAARRLRESVTTAYH